MGQHKLSQGRTVTAAAVLLQDLYQEGIGVGLNCEIFSEALIPCKCLLQGGNIFADPLLIIDMEGCGVFLNDLL